MIDVGTDKPGHSLRMLVAQALRSYKTSHLFQFLEDKNALVRTASARELQIRGGRETLKTACALLKAESPMKRELGSFILGQLGTPRRPFRTVSLRELLRLLSKERNATVIAAALVALGHLGATEKIDALLHFSRHKDAAVRAAVAYLVGMAVPSGSTAKPSIVSAITKLSADKVRSVRSAAAFARERLVTSQHHEPNRKK